MPEGPPPGRYRIVERGRRLVTIDTRTGEEFGLKSPPQSPVMGGAAAPLTPPKLPSALNPAASSRPALSSPSVQDSDKVGRVIAVAVVAIMFAVFAFMTGLWIAVAIVLAIPQTRTPMIAALGGAIRKFVNGAN